MVDGESLLKSIQSFDLPPVEKWDPEYCGELDLHIKADGTWLYQGTPFTRKKLILLFSRVIKKENNQYYLVTPVEKVSIKVDWMPFTIIDFEVIDSDQGATYCFVDNCDNQVSLNDKDQLQLSLFQSQLLPTINVRRNLYASFSRNCYYRLLQDAEIRHENGRNQVIIQSQGIDFSLGEFKEDDFQDDQSQEDTILEE